LLQQASSGVHILFRDISAVVVVIELSHFIVPIQALSFPPPAESVRNSRFAILLSWMRKMQPGMNRIGQQSTRE
jgi:hypothetical protein